MAADVDAVAGVITVQLGLASAAEVGAARRRGAVVDSLQGDGGLAASQRAMIAAMAADALAAHGGDVTRAAESIGGAGALDELEHAATVAPDADVAGPLDERVTITREQPGRYVAPGSEPSARELGRGGIGRVLVMHDAHLGRDVALKELLPGQRPGSAGGSQTIATTRFLREARITGRLEHPNIVPVYELGRRRDGSLYYTMKVVNGRTLADVLAEKRTLGERLSLLKHFADLCNAMAYAHDRGIIHRDLKPGNVMVGAFGETVLLDWGLAKPTGSGEGEGVAVGAGLDGSVDELTATADGAVLGTPLYMSPEQAKGEEGVGPQADVWSLGVMLYELLVGRRPFGGNSAFAVLDAVVRGDFVPVRVACPEAPPELAAVVERALSVDRERRYAHAGALADEIGAFLVGGRVRAYRYGVRELLGRFARRYRVALAVAGVAVVLLAGLAVVAHLHVMAERDRAQAAHAAAADAERVARAARDDAEGLVQYLVGDLREKLEPLGRLDLLDGVVARVDGYLERALPAGSDAMADEARARSRAATLYLVARLEAARGRLEPAAEAADEARRLRVALVERGSGAGGARADDRVALARSELQSAAILRSRGRRGPAQELTEAALGRLVALFDGNGEGGAEPSPDALRARAEAHVALGELAATGGDLPTAERHARDALVWQERLVAREPDEHEWQAALAHGHDRVGNARLDQGDVAGAEAAYQAALALRTKLVGVHPDNLGWVRALGVSHDQIGDLHTERGAHAAAAVSYAESARLLARAAAQNPTHLGWRRDAAVGQLKVGDAAAHQDQREAALAAYGEAEAVLGALVEQESRDIDWLRDLDVVRWRRADQLIGLGRLEPARAALDAALVDAERIVEQVPGNALYRHDLAIGHFKRADLAARAGDPTGAAVAYRAAAKILARLAEDDPSNAAVRRDLDAARGRLAAVVQSGQVDAEVLWSAVRAADATARIRPGGAAGGPMRGRGVRMRAGQGGGAGRPAAEPNIAPAPQSGRPAAEADIAPAPPASAAPAAQPAIAPGAFIGGVPAEPAIGAEGSGPSGGAGNTGAGAPAARPAIRAESAADAAAVPPPPPPPPPSAARALAPPVEALFDDPDLRLDDPASLDATADVGQPWIGAPDRTRPRIRADEAKPASRSPTAQPRIDPDREKDDGASQPRIRPEPARGAPPASPRVRPAIDRSEATEPEGIE